MNEISWCKIALREFQDVLEGAKCQDGVVLRGLAADWYVKSDRYILAYLAKIVRLAFAAHFRATWFTTASHYACNLLNKFLTVIQTDFRFHAKCHSEAEMIFKWRVYQKFICKEPHFYSIWKLTVEQYLIKNVEDNYQWWHYKWVPWRQQNSSISDNNERWAPALETPIIVDKYTRGCRVHRRAGTLRSSGGVNIMAASSTTTIKCVYLDSKLLFWSPINMLHLVRWQITIYRRLFPWFVSLHCYISLSIFPFLSLYIAMLTQNISHIFDNVAWHASHSILKKVLNILFFILLFSYICQLFNFIF